MAFDNFLTYVPKEEGYIRIMVTERHNIAGRLITKAISKSSQGSYFVSPDVGSADKHRTQNLKMPVTAESRVHRA